LNVKAQHDIKYDFDIYMNTFVFHI